MSQPVRFDPGFVNCVTHTLSGAQVLYHVLHTWHREEDSLIVIWCFEGEAQAKANAIRVALSKERKDRKLLRTFELRFSEPFRYTHLGIKGEAIIIRRDTGTMQTQVQAAFASFQFKP